MHALRYCGLASLSYWKHVLRYSFTAGKFNYLQLSFNIPKFQHKQSKIHMSTITCIKTPVIRADIGKIYYYLRNTNLTFTINCYFIIFQWHPQVFFYILMRETVFQHLQGARLGSWNSPPHNTTKNYCLNCFISFQRNSPTAKAQCKEIEKKVTEQITKLQTKLKK